jgi:hypothetical protein
MKRASLVRGLVVLAAVAAAVLSVAAPRRDVAKRLFERAEGATPLVDDVRDLCDRIGGRTTGSAACRRSVEWSERKFREAGLASVRLESFEVPSLWLPGAAEASCLEPDRFPLRLAAAPYSPSTPGGRAIEARVVDAGRGLEADFRKLGSRATGAVALVRNDEMRSLDDLFEEYLDNAPRFEAARAAGAVAILFQSSRPRGLLYRHPATIDGTLAAMPAAVVSREHAFRLARLLETGEARVRVLIANETGGPYESRNVVAEIPGSERPDEIVLLGAHLDSWDLGTGAQDNAVNVALVLDVARAFRELGLTPRRTIRFVLFTGEEQGLWGSIGYARRHAKELDRHVAAVIFDTGSGRVQGFFVNGREDVREAVVDALSGAPAAASLEHPLAAIDGTDNLDFLLAGVPNLLAVQDPTPYLPDYHAESDVFETVDGASAKRNAALAGALVWGLSERAERPRRQSRSEVEALLVETHLVEQMKAFGQWEGWASGRRGEHVRAPARSDAP